MNALSIHVDQSIAILTLDQADSKVNVLNRETLTQLDAAIRQLNTIPDLQGLIIASAKPGIFVAGADLKELANADGPDHPPTRAFIELGLQVLYSIEDLPFPTVACIDGAALGGGLELALACDYRLAGTNPKTRMGLPEVTLGLIPGWGGTQRLPRIMGAMAALEVLLSNVQLNAETASHRGLVGGVVPSESLLQAAIELLRRSRLDDEWKTVRAKKREPMKIAAAGASLDDLKVGRSSDAQIGDNLSRPAALALLDVVKQGCVLPLREAIAVETRAFMQLVGSPEAKELIGAFFASRRK